jgi:hypothetical protein
VLVGDCRRMQQNAAPRKGTLMASNLLSQELYTPLLCKFASLVCVVVLACSVHGSAGFSFLLQLRLGKYPRFRQKAPALVTTQHSVYFTLILFPLEKCCLSCQVELTLRLSLPNPEVS